MNRKLVKIIVQHLICGASVFVAAFVFCAIVLGATENRDWLVIVFTAPLSAAVIAMLGWALLTSFGRRVKIWKAVVVGVLAGSISHFFAWYLAIVFFYLQSFFASNNDSPVGLFEGIGASLIMSFFSLGILGWFTVPIAAIVCALVAFVSRRFLSEKDLA
jgi:glucan phosphoethanolaminetransferase (alkaline phosphatase superfamily)